MSGIFTTRASSRASGAGFWGSGYDTTTGVSNGAWIQPGSSNPTCVTGYAQVLVFVQDWGTSGSAANWQNPGYSGYNGSYAPPSANLYTFCNAVYGNGFWLFAAYKDATHVVICKTDITAPWGTWSETTITVPSGSNVTGRTSLGFVNGYFYLFQHGNNTAIRSSDGVSWSSCSGGFFYSQLSSRGIYTGSSWHFAAGGNFNYSTDGVNWSNFTAYNLTEPCFFKGSMLYLGAYGSGYGDRVYYDTTSPYSNTTPPYNTISAFSSTASSPKRMATDGDVLLVWEVPSVGSTSTNAWYSTDGVNFTAVTISQAGRYTDWAPVSGGGIALFDPTNALSVQFSAVGIDAVCKSGSTATGSLTVQKNLTGLLGGSCSAQLSLSSGITLAGGLKGITTVNGGVISSIPVFAQGVAKSVVSGGVSTTIKLAGSAAPVCSVTGDLVFAAAALGAQIYAQSSSTSGLSTTISSSGVAASKVSTTASLTSAISLVGSAKSLSYVVGNVIPPINLGASLSSIVSATAALASAVVNLGSQVSGQSTLVGDLSSNIKLASSITASPVANVTTLTATTLFGPALCYAQVTGALTLPSAQLAAAAKGVSTANPDLSAQVKLASNVVPAVSVSGVLSSAINVVETLVANTSTSAAFAAQARFTSSAGCGVSVTGTLTTQIKAAGVSVATAKATGAVVGNAGLDAFPKGVAASIAALGTGIKLVGAAGGSAGASGTLQTAVKPAAQAVGKASATGVLSAQSVFSGFIFTNPLTNGALLTQCKVQGAASGVSKAQGSLTSKVVLQAATYGSAVSKMDTLIAGRRLIEGEVVYLPKVDIVVFLDDRKST